MLVAYADKYGYQRFTATNGQEAVDIYAGSTHPAHGANSERQDLQPHDKRLMVILLDINMPIMDGFEAARRIRAFERTNSMPPAVIVAVTGLGSIESRQKAHASGMDLFLTKPVRSRALTDVLASIVQTGFPR